MTKQLCTSRTPLPFAARRDTARSWHGRDATTPTCLGSGDPHKAMSLLDESLNISRELDMRPPVERVLSRREILGRRTKPESTDGQGWTA